MKSISKLKDEARRCEQQEQWEKAISAYAQVLRIGEAGEAEVELPLYNRVGDLYVRLGRPDEAVKYYEQGAEHYAEIGLYNNAMALCNKALRYRPERLEVIRRLGQYSLQQGFLTDAMQYYVSCAEKYISRGEPDEALSALEEFANTSNDADARELYARRLQSLGRTQQAIDALRQAHAQRAAAGDAAAATTLLDEIRGLDASAAAGLEAAPAGDLSLSFDSAAAAAPAEPELSVPADDGALPELTAPADDDALPELPAPPAYTAPEEAGWTGDRLDGLETAYFDAAEHATEPREPIETTDVPIEDPSVAPLEGLESTMFDTHDATGFSIDGAELGIEHDERSFDDVGYVDDAEVHAAGMEGPGLLGADELDGEDIGDPLPLLNDPFDVAAAADLTEPAPDTTLDAIDAAGPSTPEQAPGAAWPDDVTLAPDGPAVEDTPAALETVDPQWELAAARDARAEQTAYAEPDVQAERTGGAEQAGYIDLAELLSLGVEETTRFRIEELDSTGDEERDFAELLEQFKAKLVAHLPPDDAAAHYDLGLAFREMGLLDEAIMVFQIAARAGHMRLKIFEELGQCFLEKEQYTIAEKVLRRALTLEHGDELELLGVYYHLGRACEALGRREQARDAYERVLGMDINFQDTSQRLMRL